MSKSGYNSMFGGQIGSQSGLQSSDQSMFQTAPSESGFLWTTPSSSSTPPPVNPSTGINTWSSSVTQPSNSLSGVSMTTTSSSSQQQWGTPSQTLPSYAANTTSSFGGQISTPSSSSQQSGYNWSSVPSSSSSSSTLGSWAAAPTQQQTSSSSSTLGSWAAAPTQQQTINLPWAAAPTQPPPDVSAGIDWGKISSSSSSSTQAQVPSFLTSQSQSQSPSFFSPTSQMGGQTPQINVGSAETPVTHTNVQTQFPSFMSTHTSNPQFFQQTSAGKQPQSDFDKMLADMKIETSYTGPQKLQVERPEESVGAVSGAFSTRVRPGLDTSRKPTARGKSYNVPLSNPLPQYQIIPEYTPYLPAGALPIDIKVNPVSYEQIAQRKVMNPETLNDVIKGQESKGIKVSQQSIRLELLNRKKPVVTGNVDLTTTYVESERTKVVSDLDEATIQDILSGRTTKLKIPELQELIRRQGIVPETGKKSVLEAQLRTIYKEKGIGTFASTNRF